MEGARVEQAQVERMTISFAGLHAHHANGLQRALQVALDPAGQVLGMVGNGSTVKLHCANLRARMAQTALTYAPAFNIQTRAGLLSASSISTYHLPCGSCWVELRPMNQNKDKDRGDAYLNAKGLQVLGVACSHHMMQAE